MASEPRAGGGPGNDRSSAPAEPTSLDRHMVDAARAAEAAADPIIVVDAAARVVYANPATCELTGREQVESSTLESLISLADGRDVTSILSPHPHRMMALLLPTSGRGIEAELAISVTGSGPDRRWALIVHLLPRQELSIRELLRRATHGRPHRSHQPQLPARAGGRHIPRPTDGGHSACARHGRPRRIQASQRQLGSRRRRRCARGCRGPSEGALPTRRRRGPVGGRRIRGLVSRCR